MSYFRFIFLFLYFWLPITVQAGSFDVQSLTRLLSQAERSEIQYHELRQSPWLEREWHSHGFMQVWPDFLEKKVVYPTEEAWRLYHDHIAYVSWVDGEPIEVVLDGSAQMRAFIQAIRLIVEGRLLDLRDDFNLMLSGDEDQWTVILQPIDQTVKRYLEKIEVRGSRALLQELVILEPGEERTVTRFIE